MNIRKVISYWAMMITASLAACEKSDAVPGGGREGYVNFFNASEVQNQQSTLSAKNLIVINDTLPGLRKPTFYSGEYRQYPRTVTGTDLVADNIGREADVFWMPLLAGDYRFIYTSVNEVYLRDTTVNIAPKSFITQYLVESPDADDAYRIITVPVTPGGAPGKSRFQIVHLSPDFGPLDIYLSDAGGNRVHTALPASLSFSAYSPYVELDTTLATGTHGNFLLKCCKSGTDEVVATAALPAISNGSYIVLFRGFEAEASRRIKSTNTGYATVTVTPNLRLISRRIN